MKSRYLSQFRRRREGKTNYKKRLNLLLSGKPRVVVHKTNTKLIVQIIESDYGKDKTVVALESTFLVKSGWKHSMNSIPGAYLTGLKLAVDAKSKNIKNAVLDIGLLTPTKGAKVFAVLKGLVDGGLDIPHSDEKMPSDDRICGAHIDSYRKTSVVKDFEDFKKNILAGTLKVKTGQLKPVKKEAVKKEIVKDDVVKEEVVKDEKVNDKKVKEKVVRDKEVKEKKVKGNAVKAENVNDKKVKDEMIKDEKVKSAKK